MPELSLMLQYYCQEMGTVRTISTSTKISVHCFVPLLGGCFQSQKYRMLPRRCHQHTDYDLFVQEHKTCITILLRQNDKHSREDELLQTTVGLHVDHMAVQSRGQIINLETMKLHYFQMLFKRLYTCHVYVYD